MSSLTHHKLSSALTELLGDRCRLSEPLSRRTSLRIGGPASWWVEPHTLPELHTLFTLARTHHVPTLMAGLGSNTLFPDEGFDGVVIRLAGELAAWRILDDTDELATLVEVGAGCINAHLVKALLKQGYVGAEFLVLIPGVFGGGVVMNAGTHEADLGQILDRVTYISSTTGELRTVPASALHIAYRHTTLPEDAVIVSGVIRVSKGDVDAARERAKSDRARRDITQPYRLASAGSTFANPEGHYAGQLIERVGLKGERFGGAQISALHANFFINDQDATARDFLTLMARARVRVRERFGVELRPEVKFAGFDGFALLAELEAEELSSPCERTPDAEVCDVG